jgi:hypothetical protein
MHTRHRFEDACFPVGVALAEPLEHLWLLVGKIARLAGSSR